MKEKISLNRILKLVLVFAILVIAVSVSYYYAIFKPNIEKGKLKQEEQQKQEELMEQKETNEGQGDKFQEALVKKEGGRELTQEEIIKISKSIVFVQCYYDMNNNGSIYDEEDKIYGSGTYIYKNWFKGESYNKSFSYLDGYILTNGHVSRPSKNQDFSHCWASFGHQPKVEGKDFGLIGGKDLGIFFQDRDCHFWDEDLDIALLKKKAFWQGEEISRGFTESDEYLQFNLLENYPVCSENKIIGGKVYIFGYPGSAFEYTPGIMEILVGNLIVSNGIISGKNLNGDYFTDAKIDSGFSGGLAVAKIDDEICIVGIPTWIGEGQYENLGLIQSFQKIRNALKIIETP